ncbi:unnamed protein product [Mortierella alpina]
MTIAHQSASERTAAPATPSTRHRARPARKDQSPPPAWSIRRTLESPLRDTEKSSPSVLDALAASYHSSSPQDSTLITSPSASAKTRSSTRLSLEAPTHALGSSDSRPTQALRKPTPKSSDQDLSSVNSDGDKRTRPVVAAAAARVSQSPFLVADEDHHHHHNLIRDKTKAALFWTTRHSSKELQGLHAETPTKSRIRHPIGDAAVPPVRRWTRSQALEADLRKKQVARSQSTTRGGGSESDDGEDGDDEGSEGSDTPLFTDGDESPIPRTPSKITALGTGVDSSQPSKDDEDDDEDDHSFKGYAASQHMLRMQILGVNTRTQSNPGSFKRRVAAVTGYGTDEDNEDPYEQECSDGDKTPIPRTPSKRMKQASDLQGLDARSPSSPGSWLERWKLNTMMHHSSMKPPKVSQEEIDPTEVFTPMEPSEALGFATPKRKRTVFLDHLDQAPPRPAIDGHMEGDEGCEGQEEGDVEGERNDSDDSGVNADICTPVKARPLRLDLTEMANSQTASDPKQDATAADFQTPPHKHVRKDLFAQDMRPPPAPRGLSSGRRPMYFENMGTSSPIAQKTPHLHRLPSEW